MGFGDGALAGFGGNVYLRWEVEEFKKFVAALVISKARVCPLRGYTVPRSELCGALITSRLMLVVVKALAKLEGKPCGAIMLMDSRCVISALEVTSGNLLPFFQNRAAEVLENLEAISKYCPIEPVHWIPSAENVIY